MAKRTIVVIIKNEVENLEFKDILNLNFNKEYDLIYTDNLDSTIKQNPKLRPFIIICDYEEISENIFEITSSISKNKATQEVPLILCITEDNLDNIVDYQIDDFIKKPFNEKVLIARLKLILKKSDLRNQLNEKTSELKEFLKEKDKLYHMLSARDLALNKTAAVAIINKKGILIFINDKFCSTTKYSKHELIGKDYKSIVYSSMKNSSEYEIVWRTIYRGDIWRGEVCSKTKLGDIIWTDTAISPIYDEKGRVLKFFTIHFDVTDRKNFERELKDKNESVTLSINYASRIQKALLPSNLYMTELVNEYFVFYKPRDIVSGDFYWMKQISHLTVFAVADCTGHGVPGAFMSMLGFSFLNEIVTFRNSKLPSQILNELRLLIKQSLHQDDIRSELEDGMDIVICSIDSNNKKMFFAGAMNYIYIIRNKNLPIIEGVNITKFENETNNLFQIDGDDMPLGVFYKEDLFKTTIIDLLEDDIIYGFSDGYGDQFGGENNIKFTTKKFRNLLLEICNNPLETQKKLLQSTYDNWVTAYNKRQIDDILILGIKI